MIDKKYIYSFFGIMVLASQLYPLFHIDIKMYDLVVSIGYIVLFYGFYLNNKKSKVFRFFLACVMSNFIDELCDMNTSIQPLEYVSILAIAMYLYKQEIFVFLENIIKAIEIIVWRGIEFLKDKIMQSIRYARKIFK